MWQVSTANRVRRNRVWLTVAALVPAIALLLTACGGPAEAPAPQVGEVTSTVLVTPTVLVSASGAKP